MKFADWLIFQESIYDPHLLKAVVVVGGPGSGKSYISNFFEKAGFQVNNVDLFFTRNIKKAGIPLTQITHSDPAQAAIFARAATSNVVKTGIAPGQAEGGGNAGSMQPLLFETTGGKMQTMNLLDKSLKEKGYDIYVVFVSVPFEVAMQRNTSRSQKGDRTLTPETMKQIHGMVSGNLDTIRQMYGDNFIEINNDGGQGVQEQALRAVRQVISKPVQNPIGVQRLKQGIEQAHSDADSAGFMKGAIDPRSYQAAGVQPWRGQPQDFKRSYGKGKPRDWSGFASQAYEAGQRRANWQQQNQPPAAS